jgi:hypothetical protein
MSRPARPFFIPEARGPLRAVEHVAALLSKEVGSEAVKHVAAPEPSQAGRQGPKLWDMWQRRSPPEQGGRDLKPWEPSRAPEPF